MKRREKRISTRVKGLELNLFEATGLSNNQMVRYGLKKYMEERPFGRTHEIEVDIAFMEDKIRECELMIQSYKLGIEQKVNELKIIQEREYEVKYTRFITEVYSRYLEFLDNDSLTEEFRCELVNFYSFCRDAILISCMKYHLDFDEGVEYFESYLESVYGDEDIVVEEDVVSSS